MKVEVITPINPVNNAKSATKTANDGKFKEILGAKSGSKSEQTTSVNGLQFYYIEEMNQDLPDQQRKKQIAYGKKLLDELKKIRLMLLYGEVSQDKLSNINDLLLEAKDIAHTDPKLSKIISDIELRLEVEMAKL
ncbi:MAG: flagellar assembly protein FliX [Alphaproteobacteria bacterium]|nr:flagellar assembly protein FliX [Alphaproteobacteria bacterium]OJV15086.1 MAG: hypothetical protein BGO27_06580 [Alphaproteobacteria bacterium 33-17]